MSLLLQALRQIDAKLPVCSAAPIGPAVYMPTPTEAVMAEPVVSAAAILQSPAAESIVVAPFAALVEKPVAARRERRQSMPAAPADRWFADRVMALLKPADRVLAVVAADAASESARFAAKMALGLAAIEERGVLLIEQVSESRRRLPNGAAGVDLLDLIEGRATWDARSEDAGDGLPRVLRVIPSAADAQLAVGDLRRGWRAALDHVHYLVLDTSGLGEAPLTAWLRTCDAAFLVVRRARTSRGQARRQVERLRRIGADLRACVLVDS